MKSVMAPKSEMRKLRRKHKCYYIIQQEKPESILFWGFFSFNNQIRRFRRTGHLDLAGLKLNTYGNLIGKPHGKRPYRRL